MGVTKWLTQACTIPLVNPHKSKSSELIYNVPIKVPMMVLHVDAYQAGAVKGFEGFEVYLNVCCEMCSFAAMEPVSNASAKTFTSALMHIILRYSFCYTVVLDKDSKFTSVFKESLNFLRINYHILSGNNHNPMLVERINRYLNKGLRIMTNDHDSIRIALKAILLLIYAWSSCPVPGTDISRSLVAVGREFSFPIDFSARVHVELTSAPGAITSYSRDLVERLNKCQDITNLLVCKQLGNLSMLAALILAFTLLATSFLLGAPLDPIPNAAESINSCTLSQDHGTLHAPSQVLLRSSSSHRIQNGLSRSTLPICPHTQQS